MLPVQFGYESDVPAYAATLIKNEKQLLISLEGNLFLTLGDGTFKQLGNSDDMARDMINNIATALTNLQNNVNNINASSILVDVNINGTLAKISLQDVITNILTSVGGYVATAECGEAESGTVECGE